MKSLLIVAGAVAAATPAPLSHAPQPVTGNYSAPPQHCRDSLSQTDTKPEGRFKRLGDLPEAEAYQAVYRLGADGCLDPMLVSERINGRRR